MQQFYRLEGKVENQFQHMEDDIEELKSKVKNGPQEGSRKETEAMKKEIENLSEDFERAQRDVSNIGIIQIILCLFFYICFFVYFYSKFFNILNVFLYIVHGYSFRDYTVLIFFTFCKMTQVQCK